ncbi:MAG: hypothetical protein COA37_15340 [Hoeflea sp.]|nr:MAG: hypothetical protein COA37_15340 [Hoeflea sp.]
MIVHGKNFLEGKVMAPTGTFQIDGTLTGDMGHTMVVPLTGGGFVIAWDERPLGILSTYYRAYDASGNAVSSVLSPSESSDDHQHLLNDLIALPSGGFALSWTSRDTSFRSTQTGYFLQEFDENGLATSETYRVAEQYILSSTDQTGLVTALGSLKSTDGLELAVNDEGDLVGFVSEASMYQSADGFASYTEGVFSIDLSGGGKGEAYLLSPAIQGSATSSDAYARNGDITFLDDGTALAAYIVIPNPYVQDGVYARLLDDDGKPTSDPFLVAENFRTLDSLKITTLSNGNALLTWAGSVLGGLANSWYRIIDKSGNFLTDVVDLGDIGIGSPDAGFKSSWHLTVSATQDGGFIISNGDNTVRFSSTGSIVREDYAIFDGSNVVDQIAASAVLKDGSIVVVSTAQYDGQTRDHDVFAKILAPDTIVSMKDLFSTQSETVQALSAAYAFLLGGVPNEAGYTFLINGAVSTNFGAGAGVTFNQENKFINLVNNLVQDNVNAKAQFNSIASGTTLQEKITAIYKAVVPLSKQSDEGLAFITRADGLKFYQDVAAERGVAGTDGAAIVALASLLKIAVTGDYGIGNSVNDLLKAVAAGSSAIPISGSTLTPIETADGNAFDADDASLSRLATASRNESYIQPDETPPAEETSLVGLLEADHSTDGFSL